MRWTPERIALLRARYPVCDTAEVAAALGCTERAVRIKACELKVKKRAEAKRVWTRGGHPNCKGFGRDPGEWNRGKPSPKRAPIGTEFVSNRGEVYVKVALTGQKNVDWRRKSHVVWERHNPPLAPGQVLSFVDGNRLNCAIENLALSTKGQIMQKNSIHSLPRVIADLYRAKGRIVRAARRIK